MPAHSPGFHQYKDDGVIVHVRDSDGIEIAAFVGPRRLANARLFCAADPMRDCVTASLELFKALVPAIKFLENLGEALGHPPIGLTQSKLDEMLGIVQAVLNKADGLDVLPPYKD